MPMRRAQQVEVDAAASRMFSPSSSTSPVGALAGIEVVHAVEHAQQRRLAAARRADERR
jgi:hypothetical protein